MAEQKSGSKKLYVILGLMAAVYLGFKGYQWIQNDYYRTLLQKEFNRQYKDWGRGSFCYKVGKVNFPYIDRGYPVEFIEESKQVHNDASIMYKFPNYRYNSNLYRLHYVLPAYYEAGLLSRQLLDDGSGYYQYDLTEQGKKYQSEYDGQFVFCYGYQQVQGVTDITEQSSNLYPGKQYIDVTYNYEIDDLPDWVNNEHFRQAYGLSSFSYEDKKGTAHETFIKGQEGIFIDGRFNSHIYPAKIPAPE